jgi:hypothetical protein
MCIVQGDVYESLCDFLRECKVISSNKLGRTVSQKNAELYVLPFGTSTRLWIPLTDERCEIRHFSVSIFDWSFLALHLVRTLISNHGDSTERTLIHLQCWYYGNQSNEHSVIPKEFQMIKRLFQPSDSCPGYGEPNKDGTFLCRPYHEEFVSKSPLQCGSAGREPCMKGAFFPSA